jgi:heme a synthase
MTLDEFKFIFFWEYLHRLLARMIGLVFLVPFVVFWVRGWLTRPLRAARWCCSRSARMQGVMGWFMVMSGLVDRPSVSHYRLAAHLSLAFLIFGYAVWLARDLAQPVRRAIPWMIGHAVSCGADSASSALLLGVQIVWGAFVAGLKAGLVFNTFPLMGGRLVPPNLLALEPAALNFVQNPVTVQWTHRCSR